MGAGASVQQLGEGTDLRTFVECFCSLADGSGAGKGARGFAWAHLDKNKNRYASLAELDSWVQGSLREMVDNTEKDHSEADRIWKAFRPSYIRAFNDAKDIGLKRSVGADGKEKKGIDADEYLQKGEFRLCAAYLCLYAMMYDAFALLDGGGAGVTSDDDRKVSLDELKAGYAAVQAKNYGFAGLKDITAENCEDVFKQMDKDGKGAVMLVEFCGWIEAKEKEHKTAWGEALGVGEDAAGNNVEPVAA